jgi:exodeoxyribonuclease VII large subunit
MSESPRPFTVGEICADVRGRLEKHFASVDILGEVTNFTKNAASGHAYFSLRDRDERGSESVLSALIFKADLSRVKFEPRNGMRLVATGKLTIYSQQGRFQLQARALRPIGIGERELAFQQLQEKLRAEGLFDPMRKRQIPRFPARIGVATSTSGSAVRDILEKLRERWPIAEVRIFAIPVQGERAASAIAATLAWINILAQDPDHRIDVLILGRGGGSVEDLWTFNEEIVARAVASSVVPIISGVGHEDDRTICDLVADQRALTPTDAAIKATPSRTEILDLVHYARQRLDRSMRDRFEDLQTDLRHAKARLRRDVLKLHLDALSRRVSTSRERLKRHIIGTLEKMHLRLRALAARLDAVSPLQVLGRGYSLTQVLDDSGARKIVFDATDVQLGQKLETTLARGRIVSIVT